LKGVNSIIIKIKNKQIAKSKIKKKKIQKFWKLCGKVNKKGRFGSKW
jgi:protein tyrosine phosphatase